MVLKARPIPLEVIFRFEVAGSFAETFHLAKGMKFESVFIEFTFKDDEQGDPRISEWSIVKDRIAMREQLDHIIDMAKTIAHTTRDFCTESPRWYQGLASFPGSEPENYSLRLAKASNGATAETKTSVA